MKVNIVVNGTVKLALTPETELEKQVLSELFKGEVVVNQHQTLQLLDKNLVDSVVITGKAVE